MTIVSVLLQKRLIKHIN